MSPAPSAEPAHGTRRERIAWCLFDFANSAFPTIALTAFGGPFFEGVLARDGVDLGFVHLPPAAAWGATISVSMAIVTITSPVMGAIADRSGKKKALLAWYVGVCVLATAALGLLGPGSGALAFIAYVIANVAFEGAYVFYNAFLPDLAPPERLGRLSGYGWAFGYVGGLLALILVKPLVPAEYTPEAASGAGPIFLVVAGWYLLFSLPALLYLRDRPPARPDGASRGYVRAALTQLGKAFRTVRVYPAIGIFLLAYFLYNDAIITVIEFVGIYTKSVLEFTPGDNVTLFLVLNVIAAPGALLFGFLLDRIGGKRAIISTLVLWIIVVVGASLAETRAAFWPVAILAAVVIGATQASSRALLARLAPRERVGELMGFLAFSGKASAIFGPTVYGVVASAAAAGSPARGHRIAIAVLGVFFAVSLLIMLRLDEKEGMRQAREGT